MTLLAPLALPVVLTLASASAKEEGKKLEAIRVELEERRSALSDLENQQRSLVDSLGELDETMARLNDEALAARQRLEALRIELGGLEVRANTDEKELASLKVRLESRMRALYVGGEGGAARALLGAEGFQELALRRRFLQKLAQNDAKLVGEVARMEQSVRDHREKLRQSTIEAEMTAKLIEEQRSLMEATRAERQAAIKRLSTEKQLASRQAKDLELKREGLAMLLKRLVEEENRRPLLTPKPSGKRAGILKSKLYWPIDGGKMIRKFGVVVDKDTKAEIVSNGIEIRAEEGAPIAAVADGRVVHVGWMRGFGRVVILDHGEGHHTISAHIMKPNVNRGDEVKRGQTIAFVGDTESTNGPKLYFELRENGRPRNPEPYLK